MRVERDRFSMAKRASSKRPPAVHVTLQRAARLHRLVAFLATAPNGRTAVLTELRIGLRTFYRELELLKKRGIKVRFIKKLYHLIGTRDDALGRLPVPDPELSFAEMAELARCPCPAGLRLAELLAAVVTPPPVPRKRATRGRSTPRKPRGDSQ